MRRGAWIAWAVMAVAGVFAGCGTLGKHYDDSLPPPEPVATEAVIVGRINVETKPTGAMIIVNGAQLSTSPTSVRVDLTADGTFADSLEIAADFSVVAPVRGVSNVVTARYRRGDPPPAVLVLARAAEGGIQSLGSVLQKK